MELVRRASLDEARAALPDDSPYPMDRTRASLARERRPYGAWRLNAADIGQIIARHQDTQRRHLIRDLVCRLPLDAAGHIRPHSPAPLRDFGLTNELVDLVRAGGTFRRPPVLKLARWVDALSTGSVLWKVPALRCARWRIADGRHRLFAAYLAFTHAEQVGQSLSIEVLAPG